MDFIRVGYKQNKDGTKEYYPSLQVQESTDLVIRGGQFAAIWDEDKGLYSRKLSHLPSIIDRSFAKMVGDRIRPGDSIRKIRVFDNGIYSRLMGLIRNVGDMGPDLDQTLIFANETPVKSMAATFKMPYSLNNAATPAWDEILNTLYEPEERLKIEWAIGSIFAGASVDQIQKFYVFYGPPGSGKSTILNIIELLFEGHVSHFSAFDMGKGDSQFSLEPFSKNPLVAVDQDGDLSKIDLNKNLNSIVSHDRVLINSKGKNIFEIKPRATLFVGTNEPIKISNRKSGLFRRLVDIQPSGRTFDEIQYHHLVNQVKFELGSIATKCERVFLDLGPTYLSSYRSTDMMYRTNDIFNFVEDNRMVLSQGLTLKQAYKMYDEWCSETGTKNIYRQYQFRDILADYFKTFHEHVMIDGKRYRSYFENLRELERFDWSPPDVVKDTKQEWLVLESKQSLLDEYLANELAQYSSESGTPTQAWANVNETLSEIDTQKEHYVKVPHNHIVLDFDLKDEYGDKNLELNLKAAMDLPPTYAEVSRSGKGLHLHYIFEGDVEHLANKSKDGTFEIKTLLGGSGLRRRVILNNNHEIATISSGLPFKEDKVITPRIMSSEKSVRDLIIRALTKNVHPGTKSNMDFIEKVLSDAYNQGLVYDVTDMWDDILTFAMGSTNQKSKCLDIASSLKLRSEESFEEHTIDTDKPIAIFDCEVYPNLFAIGWIYEDAPDDQVVKMLNPTPAEVDELLSKLRLVGFNNRRYDAHILWARTLGYDNQALYELSQRIISGDHHAMFGSAYNLCYADVYDYASTPNKKSLKKWEIELGLPHKEMDLPWDEPVPEDRVEDVLDYLDNDVLSTRAVKKHIHGDFIARQILATLSGLEIINTTRQHTERIIFGTDTDVERSLVYTDLHEMFPGYNFDRFAASKDKSTYKGETVGEGGLVRATPGIYENVALLDVASMHPTSIIELNLFGKYTNKFKELMDVRLAIKRGDLDVAAQAFDGRLKDYVNDPEQAKNLGDALKVVINSVYGFTAATFPNKFKDPQNIDNIVAKRGSLFMLDLRDYVRELGFEIVHIKTDSVKIPNATPEVIDAVFEFGKKYGYQFEHETTYEKMCLVNDAVYIACTSPEWEDSPMEHRWVAVGAQFQHPIVFKTLFSKDEIKPKDYVEIKQVSKGSMVLVSPGTETESFVGRFGAFVPVLEGRQLLRIDGDKRHAVVGTKGYLWEIDENAFEQQMEIDQTYYQMLIDDALRTIEKFGSYEEFIS